MIRSRAVEQIKRGLTFRTGTTIDDEIVFELQEAQRRLENGEAKTASGNSCPMPWFLAEWDATVSVTSGVAEIGLPSGFLGEMDGEGPYYTPSSHAYPIHLRKWNTEPVRRTEPDLSYPQFYQIRTTTFKLFPAPVEDLTLYWSYIKADDILNADIENKWLQYAPGLLIGLAGAELAADSKHASAVEKFEKLFARSVSGLIVQNFRRETDNRRSQMGGG